MEKKCLIDLTLVVALAIMFGIETSNSVIMPPRFHSTRPDTPDEDLLAAFRSVYNNDGSDSDGIPHVLSINEGDSIQVKVNSHSAITINLNKAVPEDIVVNVSVFSGPGLIRFPDDKLKMDYSSEAQVIYKANNFGDRVVSFTTTSAAGHAEIVCKVSKQPNGIHIDDSSAYISINIGRSWALNVIIKVVGWIYFFAWSLSFYFQVILNYQRKSVVGLNFDFLALNLFGFTCYSIYNSALIFSRDVQKDYYERNTYGRIPVEYNDLFFAVHAFLITLVTVAQCFIYERGDQKVSVPTGLFIGITSALGLGLFITRFFHVVTILDVVLYLSYVKLAITVIKYTPQAYMNYKRKATTGWSIHNILLDFTGGTFSITQMFLLSYNYDDWISIFGNFTKFGLGVISIFFDIIFVTQHYILYREQVSSTNLEELIPSPVISQSIISTSFRRQSDDENEPTM